MAFETGTIYEFSNSSIILTIYNPADPDKDAYKVKMGPTTVSGMVHISWNHDKYCATIQQAKDHIRLALKIASISQYSTPHYVKFSCPFYPNLAVPVEKIETILPVIDQILASYA